MCVCVFVCVCVCVCVCFHTREGNRNPCGARAAAVVQAVHDKLPSVCAIAIGPGS